MSGFDREEKHDVMKNAKYRDHFWELLHAVKS